MKVAYSQGPDWMKYAKIVLFWNWLAWFFNFMDRGLIGPLLPLMRPYFHLSLTAAGGVVSLFFVGYLSTFVGGLLSDRLGRKKVIAPSVLGFGTVTMLTSLARSTGWLSLIRIITGIFEGFQYSPGAAWLSETYPHAKRGKALAIWETGYSLGTLGGMVLATLVGVHWGWRAPWPVAGVLSIVAGILMIVFVKERPQHLTPAHDELKVVVKTDESPRIRDVFRMRNVWVVFILHGLYNFTFWMAGAWITTYIIKVKHLSLINGGLLSAMLFGGVSIGLILNGAIGDKIGRVKTVSLLTFVSAIIMFAFTQVTSPFMLYLTIILVGLFGAYISSAIALVTDTSGPQVAGTAFGICTFGGEIGAVLGPVLGGFVAQYFGFQTAFYMLPISLLLAGIIVWIARDVHKEFQFNTSDTSSMNAG
ncbi:MFS transporter [Alicyclobacillus mengziensis]|uniref:MFS transporter n=1 Tax=Alicyclobacillus mengziensis TaxID=2931921 RepID=A0A9X7VZ39_9BACL|nr:MFS transporter [Alicyclobacillus mengziensis]QSO47384.1 MFS transporter [Alicyclobacillus mengziensis]